MYSLRNRHTSLVYLSSLLLLISACATYTDIKPGTSKEIVSPVTEREIVTLTPEISAFVPSPDYIIGSGDSLQVTVAGKPEFSVTVVNSGSSRAVGSRVDGSGDVHLPLLGAVRVAGLTVSQARKKIQESLQKYLNEPWVTVEVADFRSQPIYLLGQFRNSGVYYMDRPLTLVQGVALGNGFDPAANLRGARISRDNRILRVDLADLLTNGDARQNIWLKGGDSIYVPDTRNQQVFVFGAVKKAGPLQMPPSGMNLLQAISGADLRDTGYDITHIRVIRSISATRGELLVVNLDKSIRGEALPFQLQEGDIIFVPKSSFGTWNDAIAEMLPSLQTVSAILQPFVSIKYLSQ